MALLKKYCKKDKMNKLKSIITILIVFQVLVSQAQCFDDESGIVWFDKNNIISFQDIASHAAPMLWFSPDETYLYGADGKKQLPDAFPFEKSTKPVVYYKIMRVYTNEKNHHNSSGGEKGLETLDLMKVQAIDIDFYYYFRYETGVGSHLHDIESIKIRIEVLNDEKCDEGYYGLKVIDATGRAHGLHWYDNFMEVDAQTFFPLSILIEEGKHASATDKNADGIFTPGYDVTKRINDAWGVRDIITSGKLVSGGYEAWMTKRRTPESIVFPPIPVTSPNYKSMHDKFGKWISEESQYELRPYPDFPRQDLDKGLNKLMKGKDPHNWPVNDFVIGEGSIKRWAKENSAYKSFGVAYRWDDSKSLAFTLPLLLFKTVEAPMTGGYFYNKFSFGLGKSSFNDDKTGGVFGKAFSHQIVHTNSASRWIDTYVGMGYEIYDINFLTSSADYKAFFVSEAGLKLRLNVSHTPVKFLKYLGTEFWGVRLGWKNTGFKNFLTSGFVLEIGAGVF